LMARAAPIAPYGFQLIWPMAISSTMPGISAKSTG
jgi:hypothetical protein